MSDDTSLWLILILIGLATILPRVSFIVLGERAHLPSSLLRALRYAPPAALAALIVPDLLIVGGGFQPFNPKLLAAAVAAVAATMWSQNPWLPFVAGMAALLGMRHGLGW
jgi:branched-subunit amino acid transport protein